MWITMSYRGLSHFGGLLDRIEAADARGRETFGPRYRVGYVVIGRAVWEGLLEESHPRLQIDVVEGQRRAIDADFVGLVHLTEDRSVEIFTVRE